MAWPKSLTAAQQAHNERQKADARQRWGMIAWWHHSGYSVERIALQLGISESRVYELLKKAREAGLSGG